jgi:hypothetical protein
MGEGVFGGGKRSVGKCEIMKNLKFKMKKKMHLVIIETNLKGEMKNEMHAVIIFATMRQLL